MLNGVMIIIMQNEMIQMLTKIKAANWLPFSIGFIFIIENV